MQNLRDIIMNEPAEARLTRECEAAAQTIIDAAIDAEDADWRKANEGKRWARRIRR